MAGVPLPEDKAPGTLGLQDLENRQSAIDSLLDALYPSNVDGRTSSSVLLTPESSTISERRTAADFALEQRRAFASSILSIRRKALAAWQKANPGQSAEDAIAAMDPNADGGPAESPFSFAGITDRLPDQDILVGHSYSIAEREQRAREADLIQIQSIESGAWEYFVDGSVFLSIEPLVAIRPGLEAVPIPSIGINYRPFNLRQFIDGGTLDYSGLNPGLSALALQLTLGGALNPGGGEGSSEMGGALGVGFSYPIAGIGSISVGSVWYQDENDEDRSAPYLSVTLGDFGQKASQDS